MIPDDGAERSTSPSQPLPFIADASARLAAIVESSDDAIIDKTLDGTITDWNRAAELLYGYSAEEIIGRSASLLMPPDSEPEFEALLERIRRGESVTRHDTVRLHKDGTRLEVSLSISPIRDAAGLVIGASTIGRDVGERRRAEAALRESEALRDTAERIARLGSFRRDLDSTSPRVTWSRGMYALFDVDPGEFDGDPLPILATRVHPGDQARVREAAENVAASGEPAPVEFRVIRRDGSEHILASEAATESDAAGTPVAIVGYYQDVTEARRAEAAMLESAERHRTILQTTMDGFMIVDTDGRLLDVNEAYCRMSGYGSTELLSMSLGELESAEAEDDTRAHIEKIIARGEGRFETRHRRKDGSVYEVEASVQYRPADGGQFVVFLRDVTERLRSERLMILPSQILAIMAESRPVTETAQGIVAALQLATGLDAVGVRLKQGDDFPFLASLGYSSEFLRAENGLAEREPGGGLCRRDDGAVDLECTCGLVIGGATDPANPLFTAGGSAWTNDALPFLDTPPEEDPRLHPRNRCIHVGFRSLALVPLRTGEEILGLLHLADRGTGRFTPESVAFFEGLGASIGVALLHKQAEQNLVQSAHELREQLFDTVKAMGAIVGVRDPYTAAHEMRVTQLALAIAAELRLDDERREGLALAGEVHDIGKVAVPAEILSKPTALSEIEFTLVRQHAETGREILSTINFRQPVATIVAQHHERLDGSGYPDGLKGDEIMLEARILAVADVVEAMSSHRPYRPGLGIEAALAEIEAGAGTRYDGEACAAASRLFREQGFTFAE